MTFVSLVLPDAQALLGLATGHELEPLVIQEECDISQPAPSPRRKASELPVFETTTEADDNLNDVSDVCCCICVFVCFLLLFILDHWTPKGRLEMFDVSPLSGTSTLSFDSSLLPPLWFFSLLPLLFLSFFLPTGPFF